MIHERLVKVIGEEFGPFILEGPEIFYDGVKVKLKNGFTLTVIYPRDREYLFSWCAGDRKERIDTAPVHNGLKTFPNHYHTSRGEVKEDPLTAPSRPPEENLRQVMRALLEGRP